MKISEFDRTAYVASSYDEKPEGDKKVPAMLGHPLRKLAIHPLEVFNENEPCNENDNEQNGDDKNSS